MKNNEKQFEIIKFAGLTLGGGKGRKTALSILEYYVDEEKLFLAELDDTIEEKAKQSADTQIVKLIEKHRESLHSIGISAPLKAPKCIRCRLPCPGHERCVEPEIRWMWKMHKKRGTNKNPNKLFTPYTERCVEQYINAEIDPEMIPDHAFGSNRAPMAARAQYLKRRLEGIKIIEVLPRLSVWRIGHNMGFRKSQLPHYKHATKGAVVRQHFLNHWNDQGMSFVYHRDSKLMVKDAFAFESFICAYTAFLQYKGLCEPRPKEFPRGESWISFPQERKVLIRS